MNKVTIENFSVTIVQADDGQFLLVDRSGNLRVAKDVDTMLEIIKNVFQGGKK